MCATTRPSWSGHEATILLPAPHHRPGTSVTMASNPPTKKPMRVAMTLNIKPGMVRTQSLADCVGGASSTASLPSFRLCQGFPWLSWRVLCFAGAESWLLLTCVLHCYHPPRASPHHSWPSTRHTTTTLGRKSSRPCGRWACAICPSGRTASACFTTPSISGRSHLTKRMLFVSSGGVGYAGWMPLSFCLRFAEAYILLGPPSPDSFPFCFACPLTPYSRAPLPSPTPLHGPPSNALTHPSVIPSSAGAAWPPTRQCRASPSGRPSCISTSSGSRPPMERWPTRPPMMCGGVRVSRCTTWTDRRTARGAGLGRDVRR